jgi:3-deoxy-D-manno-octulosonate 8-phosphate phosphatase (KDO 8-P phosphatase)
MKMHLKTREKLSRTRLLLLDVDGVLTRGDIIYDDRGVEIKRFNVKDGLGIRLLMDAGTPAALVTGRRSGALAHRSRNLGIDLVFDGVKDKAALLGEIEKKTGVGPAEMAFMGDDLPDLPIMKRVGLSIAVSNAHQTVREKADMVTTAPGGEGAVREVCESILKAKGLWEDIVGRFVS